MIEIKAITSDGGMIIGVIYKVSPNVAEALTKIGRAIYVDKELQEKVKLIEKPKQIEKLVTKEVINLETKPKVLTKPKTTRKTTQKRD